MTDLMIRDIDDGLEQRLRLRAAQQKRTVEDEAREILRGALAATGPATDHPVTRIRQRVAALGGVELDLPTRGPLPDPPDFR